MKIYIAIPALNELDYLPKLIEDLRTQIYQDFKVFICVNNSDNWWDDDKKKLICENNVTTLGYLKSISGIDITVIDKASQGKGWIGKKKGVGYARQVLFEAVNAEATDDDIVISLDADTRISEKYIKSVLNTFQKNKKALLLTNPYYHDLTEDERTDAAILRYELYMRYYMLNLLKIGSPYAFSALGSAIAFKTAGYRKINGITPKEAGEDFYFVNRMKKAGEILIWNDEVVRPSSRGSDRVPFGTGPAVIKGIAGNWESYPFYDMEAFEKIGKTYECLPELYKQNIETPTDDFIKDNFGKDIWTPLRKNFKTEKNFIRACHEKLDGLRILQALKYYQTGDSLKNFIKFSREELNIDLRDDFNFEDASINRLNEIRDIYFEREMILRKKRSIL
ncbi:MAG: glycosyltransferase family 2 protein [Candidatus Delongbacteria bacterium]|jgi:cellulose synthase/poly-beta-1,6-N-acetylglucosamine synthase-like glycosyltransferase|nr:glycosyltransferase family 2 protein [Candidatus Delongbacteria bacterium]